MAGAVAIERELIVLPGPTLSGNTVMQAGQSAGQGGGILQVVDQSLVTRAQFGNLPAYTDPHGIFSPAEYGIRVMDASGNLIFDPQGLVGVVHLIAANVSGGGTYTGPFTNGLLPTTTTFTLSRRSHLMTFYRASGWQVSNTGANLSAVNGIIDGAVTTTGIANLGIVNNVYQQGSWLATDTLDAGTHTYQLALTVPSGASVTITDGYIANFLMGA